MSNIGIMGTSGRVFNLANKSFERSFSEVGGNTGNLIFQYATSKLTSDKKEYFNWECNPNDVNKRCRVLILPLANQLGTHTDYSRRAEFISKIDIPIIALGLGAQSHVNTDESAIALADKISSGTKDWLQEISSRSEKILVRGPYTTKVCKALGVNNIESFGCPSNLISEYRNLGERFNLKMNELKPHRLILNSGFYAKGKSNYSDIVTLEKRIINEVGYMNLSTVTQAPRDVVSYSYGETLSVDRIMDIFDGISNNPKIESFFDIDSWSHFLRSSDISIGTRIHGAMLSLQNLHPTLLITHDSRTKELANIMHLPSISLKQALNCENVMDMITETQFNPAEYDNRRAEMAGTICSLFDNYKISPSKHIKHLSKK